MANPFARTWNDAPELAIPEMPAIFSDCYDLWLAYVTTSDPRGHNHAIIRFGNLIYHRLSPINDEGIGKHPYSPFGIRWYSFNEIINSPESAYCSPRHARHWVITFKDGTLDVVAQTASVVAKDLEAASPLAALLFVAESVRTLAEKK